MDVNIWPLSKIFGLPEQYRVPLFQRPYVWNQETQWEPLWDDVVALADRYLSGDGRDIHHFMGAVVVRQQPNPVGMLQIREIIDGQQRLTTLQVLADAVEEAMRESDGPELDRKWLKTLTLNNPDLFAGDDQYKVLPTTEDQAVFRLAMNDSDSISEEYAEMPIARAHGFFKSSALKWASESDVEHTSEERMKALVQAIVEGLHLVVIDLAAEDNAQAIFETLNSRGTPLLASDLVKNLLLNEAQLQNIDVTTFYADYLKDFETEWWREEIVLGRLVWPKLDAYLFYWLTMTLTREVSTQQLFPEFRRLTAGKNAANDFDFRLAAESMNHFGGVFRRLEDEQFVESALLDFFYRWKTAQLRVLTPVLMWLFSDSCRIDEDQRLGALELIESWFMRRIVCGYTARGYQNFLHPLLREVKKVQGDAVPQLICDTLLGADAWGTLWPDDEEVREASRSRPIYRNLSRARLRLVLEAVEDRLRSDEGKTEENCPRNLTIEHIMPVARDPQLWPLPTDRRSEDRDKLIHTLGNLTLVTAPLNAALSNSRWIDKRIGLDDHSTLYLNKKLLYPGSREDGWRADWNDASIEERGEWMARRICEIWPRPS